MKDIRGNLENEIMNAIWDFEEFNEETEITVNAVFEVLNEGDKNKAYTTIKTVMDRLVEKKILTRKKIGKKFSYHSVTSRKEMAQKAIYKLASQYFKNNMKLMLKEIENEITQPVK